MPRAGLPICVALAALAMLGALPAAAGPGVQPFPQFLRGLDRARAGAYVGAPGAAVQDAAAFEQMRRHLLRLYQGMTVARSFAQDGQVFDCVPIGQQPGLRRQGRREPAPTAAALAVQAQQCADGTIPMRRVTLAEITRFATLQDFLHKSPGAAPGLDRPPPHRP